MAGINGLKGTVSLYGVAVTELTDVSIEATRDDHDVSDLGDWIKQHAGGQLNVMIAGNARYLTHNSSLFTRLEASVSANVNATGVFTLTDPKSTVVLSGTGPWLEGGLTMPNDAMGQSFRAAINVLNAP